MGPSREVHFFALKEGREIERGESTATHSKGLLPVSFLLLFLSVLIPCRTTTRAAVSSVRALEKKISCSARKGKAQGGLSRLLCCKGKKVTVSAALLHTSRTKKKLFEQLDHDAPTLFLFFDTRRRFCGGGSTPARRAHARRSRRRRALWTARPAGEAHGPAEDELSRRRRRRRNVVDVSRRKQQRQRSAEASALAAHVRRQETAAAAEWRRSRRWRARRGPR